MESTNNQALDPLSMRADQLTKEIERHSNNMVKTACMIQLVSTDEAFLSVKVTRKDDFKPVDEFETHWSFSTEPALYKAVIKTLHKRYAIYNTLRADCVEELQSIERQLHAMGKEG